MVLKMGGRHDRLGYPAWRRFAEYCEIPSATRDAIIEGVLDTIDGSFDMLSRSLLPEPLKERYSALLRTRAGDFRPT